jgi:CheY-like chemotaxis protein
MCLKDGITDPPVVGREAPRVLVVDDEHLVRVVVQLGLEKSGFHVRLASSGQEAIHLYQEHKDGIDLVLLDVRMPDLDGPQTLDVLRQLNPNVLVCFMSGNTGAYQWEDLLGRGAAEVIAKPFHLDRLTSVLRRLLDGAACPHHC